MNNAEARIFANFWKDAERETEKFRSTLQHIAAICEDQRTAESAVQAIQSVAREALRETEYVRDTFEPDPRDAALRELASAATTNHDANGRAFEPGEFHKHVARVAFGALGVGPDAQPVVAFPAESHGDGETDPNYCEDCDGPCSVDRYR